MPLNVLLVNLSGSKIPASEYLLEKNLQVDMSNVTKLFYCPQCETLVESKTEVCVNCETTLDESALLKEGKYFLMLDVRRSLESLLSNQEVATNLVNCLVKRSSRRRSVHYANQPKHYSDIMDGDCYRSLELKDNDFTCSVNTDGVNVFKSSSFSIWPIFISINELPYKLRRKHTRLVGLWFGQKKPCFETFLPPFVDQCNSLSDEGLSWTCNELKLTSYVFFTIIAADSVARAPLQGLKQYNGSYSCPFCFNPGQSHQLSKGGKKWIFRHGVHKLRTVPLFHKHLEELAEQLENGGNKSRYGVKSSTPFIHLRQFNLVHGFVFDYMHTALLGVLKRYTLNLIDSSNSSQPFYLGPTAQAKINSRIVQIKTPAEVNRTMRDLKDVAKWKANEWKSWLLVCVPILNGILQEHYLQHLSKLVSGLLLLLSDDVKPSEIDLSEKLLKQFNKETEVYYSRDEMTFNNHLLTHAPACVRMWGPLWAYSLFQFEHANGVLGGLFRGTRMVGMQIVKKVLIIQEVLASGANLMKSNAKSLIDSLMENKKLYAKAFDCGDGVTFVGSRKQFTMNVSERKLLEKEGLLVSEIENIWSYKNVITQGKRFSSGETTKMNNCIVTYCDKIFVIRELLLIIFKDQTNSAIAFANQLTTSSVMKDNDGILKIVRVGTTLQVLKCKQFHSDKYVVVYDTSVMTHLGRLPNTLEAE
jgi:hypothetical protein